MAGVGGYLLVNYSCVCAPLDSGTENRTLRIRNYGIMGNNMGPLAKLRLEASSCDRNAASAAFTLISLAVLTNSFFCSASLHVV